MYAIASLISTQNLYLNLEKCIYKTLAVSAQSFADKPVLLLHFKWLHSNGCSLRELCSSLCSAAQESFGSFNLEVASQLGHVLLCTIYLP